MPETAGAVSLTYKMLGHFIIKKRTLLATYKRALCQWGKIDI